MQLSCAAEGNQARAQQRNSVLRASRPPARTFPPPPASRSAEESGPVPAGTQRPCSGPTTTVGSEVAAQAGPGPEASGAVLRVLRSRWPSPRSESGQVSVGGACGAGPGQHQVRRGLRASRGAGSISPRAAPAGVREAELCGRAAHSELGRGRSAGPPGGRRGAAGDRPGRRHRRL